jgi:hypothetical protein
MTTITSIAPQRPTTVARPLKVLIPLIKDDLRQANEAGLEYYRRAGDKLREARAQVPTHRWGAWISQNFELGRTTAWKYMRLSELFEQGSVHLGEQSLNEVVGATAQRRQRSAATRPMREAVAAVDVDYLAQERETREEEMRRHRALALQLIDIGYKALATRLHPDRAGGSHEGMRRLNRVRDELKSVAKTRRFD